MIFNKLLHGRLRAKTVKATTGPEENSKKSPATQQASKTVLSARNYPQGATLQQHASFLSSAAVLRYHSFLTQSLVVVSWGCWEW